MKCERYALPYGGTGYVDAYILDPEISYQTERDWPAMIVCPGGGYLITATKEGEGAAMPFLSHGFHCFVVRYSTYLTSREGLANGHPQFNENAHYPTQTLELMQVMHLIHTHAAQWHVDTSRIFAVGFSAGCHVIGTLATRWRDPALTSRLDFVPQENELRLTGAVLGYPMLGTDVLDYGYRMKDMPGNVACQMDMIAQCLFGTATPSAAQRREADLIEYLSADTCPMFLWHTAGDVVADPRTTTLFAARMLELGIPCEYHLFGRGPHGLGCANRYYAKNAAEVDAEIAQWVPLALNWLERFEK